MNMMNKYKVIITPTALKEIDKIYSYISKKLYADKAAKKLMKTVDEEIKKLKYFPEIHTELQKISELNKKYRRIVINNFVILYTIDKENKKVYVSHMYYGRTNYLK